MPLKAHTLIPSKAANVLRIKRLIIEHPDFTVQPTYRDLLLGEAPETTSIVDPWYTVGARAFDRCHVHSSNLTPYASRYHAFVRSVVAFYRYVDSRPIKSVCNLDALSFARDGPVDSWHGNMLDLGPDTEQQTTLAQQFLFRTGARCYCQRTTAGPLRIPTETDIPILRPGEAPIDIHVHLTDLHFPPPVT